MELTTDYLVIGAGASGLAFADTLVAESDAEVTVVDRRPTAGGHWQDTYPFVRLHTPSAFYGVNSRALGKDRLDETGENAGYYERASGAEVQAYFADTVTELTETGRVRVLTGWEHVGAGGDGEQVREVRTGELHDVVVRRRVVDARYMEASIPATHAPPFDVAPGVRFVPINDLPAAAEDATTFAVLGSGKTAADACTWLLWNGVTPDRIRWIRPREAWFYDRRHFQPLDQVGAIVEGFALDVEAAVAATDIDDLFGRLEDSGRLMRIDTTRPPTMYRGTMLSAGELAALRQISDVVRLGRVQRIEQDRIVLDRGETPTGPDVLHVDCTALGLNNAPATPIFQPGRIVLQQVRYLSPAFNAALIGFIEARRDDDVERNRLCPPNPYPSTVADWPRMVSLTWMTEGAWLTEPDLAEWVAASRLNLLYSMPGHADEPAVSDALMRYVTNVGAAVEALRRLR